MPPGGARIRERGRAKKGTFKRLMKLLIKEFPIRLIVVFVCIVINVFTNLCSSVFANFITNCLTKTVPNGLNPFAGYHTITAMNITLSTNVTRLLIAMAIIYAVGIFAAWFWNRSMAIITQKFMNMMRIKMFDHLQDLPIKYFDTHPHGQIMSLFTNDIDTIRQFISQALPSLVQAAFAVVFVFTAMLMNSLRMTGVTILCTIAMFLNTKFIGGRSAKYFMKQQKQVAVVEGNIEEAINGLKVIKVFSHEEQACEDFNKLNDELGAYSTEANIHGNITMPINGNIGNFMYVLTAIVGFMMLLIPGFNNVNIFGKVTVIAIDNQETIATFWGMVVAFLMMSRMFTNNVNTFSQQVVFIVMGMAGASRCFDLIDEKPEEDSGYVTLVNVKEVNGALVETEERTHKWAWKHPHQNGEVTYTELTGDIQLVDVDFSYDGHKMVLLDVSVYAHPGQQIALVGATGAGKTTITNLINRFYPLADGKVRYDGININKIKKDDLRRSLGMVLQDVNLFTGTVMENIRYGRLDATDEECIEAAKIANAHDFITRLPEGYNTMLSGDGANLSQGQRQLLSIARAAVADAPVMILDEATSSIDTRTEKIVQQGMDQLMKGRTVFAIAHRLSTIQNSNAIMCMEKGRIIERGTHDELIAKKGYYYQLYTGAFELE